MKILEIIDNCPMWLLNVLLIVVVFTAIGMLVSLVLVIIEIIKFW